MEHPNGGQPIIQPKRLHLAGMLFSFLKVIKETIFGLGIGIIATFRQSPTYALYFVALFVLLLILFSIFSWFRYTYRVEDGELRVEQGIFIRKKRYISIHRIHKIDITANVLHRMIGLVQVQIDTASSGSGAEVALSAVSKKDANALRQALKSEQRLEADGEHLDERMNPATTMTWKRLFIAGSTSGSVGVIFLAMFVLFSQLGEFIPDNVYDQTFEWLIHLGVILIVILAVVALLFIWLFGIAGTMIKYGNFRLEKREKELFIKRGLLETKELTIPFDRIQAIEIEQSLIRQPLHFVRVIAVVAGGSFEKGEPFPVLFPLLHVQDVPAFLETYLPGYEQANETLEPLAKKGRKYYLFSSAVFFILALIPVAYFFPTYSWIPGVLIIISLLYGNLKFKTGGFTMEGKRITFRYRKFWKKVTMLTFKRRIQAVEKKRHKLQQIEGLATVEISTIGQGGLGTHFTLNHVHDEDANEIADWYSYVKDDA